MTAASPAWNRVSLQLLAGAVSADLAAIQSAALIIAGHRLGLYAALAARGPASAEDLASATGTDAGYVRVWLLNQAASGYVTADGDRFSLSPEQEALFAPPGQTGVVAGYELALLLVEGLPFVEEFFRTGGGGLPEDHAARLEELIDRVSEARYRTALLSEWVPALGLDEALRSGIRVADVGCGRGAVVRMLAEAYPRSRFTGFDRSPGAIAAASESVRGSALEKQVVFAVADAAQVRGEFDLVLTLDLMHELPDPRSAARAVREALTGKGRWIIVDPAVDPVARKDLLARLFTSSSALYCLPMLRATAPADLTLGEEALRDIVLSAGFSAIRRAVEAGLSRVYEATI